MEELKNKNVVEEQSSLDLKAILTMLILNWQWFVLSIIMCLGLAFCYLRYTTPIYQASAKMLVKDDESNNSRSSRQMFANLNNLGMMTNSAGIDNEMEILQSKTISEQAIRDQKMYVRYFKKGTLRKRNIYKTQPIRVDISGKGLDKLQNPVKVEITRSGANYEVDYEFFEPVELGEKPATEPIKGHKTLTQLPSTIKTRIGLLTFAQNTNIGLEDGNTIYATIYPPAQMAEAYCKALKVAQSSKTTTIAVLTLTDTNPQRALDYLEALVFAYNRQANDDKNEIAFRTEEFINGRLEKISTELGNTDGSIEKFKRNNQMIEYTMNASQTMANANEYDQKLIEVNMQIALLNNLSTFIDDDANKYQVIPSNIGLDDPSTTQLINNYNKEALERNTLLRTASEQSPAVKPLTARLDQLHNSIKKAMVQTKKTLEIQRNSLNQQYAKYQGQVLNSPEQQRVMTEIGRQQEVQTALYTMLLQKREENSISLAATADKGRLIDRPTYNGKVKPRGAMIMLIGLILGAGIPFGILMLINYFKYKIENHEDITKLTNIPVIADIAVASESAKSKADIVVHENQNNMMEEIFRGMRTNLQFLLQEGEKVIMTTSSIAGEGKTFCVSNLAISFALLGKKVVLVGLDIRKPRLAELFEINDHKHGITPLLAMANPTTADVKAQIVPSGVNNNLDLLMAGPVPPNPAELVERKQLDTIINILKEEYDYVLLDTAPVGLVTDSLQIARVANATMAVVRADYTPKDNLYMLNELANEQKLKNLAIVLNGIDMSKKKHSYNYGYGKYGSYGRYGRTNSTYGHYGSYGNYSQSHYGDKNDHSVKR